MNNTHSEDSVIENDENYPYFIVSISLCGDSLPLETIESTLGIEVGLDGLGKKGEHRRNNPRYKKYETNIWSSVLFTSDQSGGLYDLISGIVDKFKKNKNAIKKLTALDVQAYINISISISPLSAVWEEISTEHLALFSELKFTLRLG